MMTISTAGDWKAATEALRGENPPVDMVEKVCVRASYRFMPQAISKTVWMPDNVR